MSEPDLSTVRLAVLIDADNISPRHAEAVLEELAAYGRTTIKRAYGDWTSNQLSGWKPKLNQLAISPVQQFAYTVGKNATDSRLIIDAMDLLWQDHVDAFALVSSDSDFTTLATRLRESGKRVYGIGRGSTPQSLQQAVDQFIKLELLGVTEDEPTPAVTPAKTTRRSTRRTTKDAPPATPDPEPATPEPETPAEDEAPPAPTINLQSALTRAVNAASDDDGWASLSALSQQLRRAHPAFDPREFGHTKIGTLVTAQSYLTTETKGRTTRVRIKGSRN